MTSRSMTNLMPFIPRSQAPRSQAPAWERVSAKLCFARAGRRCGVSCLWGASHLRRSGPPRSGSFWYRRCQTGVWERGGSGEVGAIGSPALSPSGEASAGLRSNGDPTVTSANADHCDVSQCRAGSRLPSSRQRSQPSLNNDPARGAS